MRLVFAEIGPEESRRKACERLGPSVGVEAVALYNWVKSATPSAQPVRPAGSVEDLKAQNAALKKENRELARRMRSCRRPRLSSGRSSTATQRGSGVRHREP